MEKISFIFLLLLISSIHSIAPEWRDYLSCKYGRLQSPISLNEYDADYSDTFSFVYEYYKPINTTKINSYTLIWDITDGGYVNFEKEAVIKQYELTKIELYKGLHEIDGEKGDYELHLVYKKNLEFNSNKNQYRKIVDANMFLTVVLRYKENCNNFKCISDNGLLSQLTKDNEVNNFNLNNYPIYQDKKAYFYEGSFLYTPCDENVNYYVVDDFFYLNGFNISIINDIKGFNDNNIKQKDRYGRPVLKNFMNYREFLKSRNNCINVYYLFLLIFILFI